MRLSSKYLALTLASPIMLVASAPLAGQPAAAQPSEIASPASITVPDTPAGERFRSWLEAFNSGERDALESIRAAFAGNAPPLDAMLGLRERSGGFTLRKIEESSATRLVALVQERDGEQFVRLVLEVDGTPDNRVLSMPLRAIDTPAEFAIARLADGALAEQLGARLEAAARTDEFSGAVLIAKNGQPVFVRAYGLADRERGLPNSPDSKFRIGSMGKMFTGTAVLQLVQAGKVSLSDPLGKFLPGYPNKDVARVTIEQLLTHTGGTGDIFTPEFLANAARIDKPQDYLELLGERGLRFEPGSRYEYSNYGYVLLGRVIEIASGEDYYGYLTRHIFEPAGMASTGFWRESEPLDGRVMGYEPAVGALRISEGTPTDRASPAGGAISTVGDLARFASALLDRRLLDAVHTDLLLTGRVPMGPNARYAFGFADAGRGTPGHRVGHNGGAPGQNGDLLIYPEAGYVVVVLANMSPPAAQRISDFVAARLDV